jgi:hypothetical protein
VCPHVPTYSYYKGLIIFINCESKFTILPQIRKTYLVFCLKKDHILLHKLVSQHFRITKYNTFLIDLTGSIFHLTNQICPSPGRQRKLSDNELKSILFNSKTTVGTKLFPNKIYKNWKKMLFPFERIRC